MIGEALLPVNISSMAHPVEEDAVPLDVIADTVIAHVDAPLPDRHIRQPTALIGVGLEMVEPLKYAPVCLGVEPAEVAAEAIRDDECKAGHTRAGFRLL
jgi:hypothetical protein